MEIQKYALILTGDVLPGYDAATVWPALAGYFRMEPDKLTAQLLKRAPVTIKESEDLSKLQGLQTGANGVGAEADIQPLGADGSVFVLLDNVPRGPVPRTFVEDRIARGYWPGSISIAAVGSNAWRPYAAPAAVRTPPLGAAPIAPAVAQTPARDDATASMAAPGTLATSASAASTAEPSAASPAAAVPVLPPGLLVNAGFWRRTSALLIDGLVIGVLLFVVQIMVGAGVVGAAYAGHMGAIVGAILLLLVAVFVGQWLYFALFECSALQATPGKLAMSLKVSDDYGARIGFGRASGRYFGKIVSGLIFDIGFMLAGWTANRQALHDMMAGCRVVFRGVRPGQPMPAARPPMPWWGWVVNIVFVGAIVLGAIAWTWLVGTLMQHAQLQSPGSGF